jgi:hypothetical protein
MLSLNKTILLILMLFLLCYSQEQPDGDDKIRVSFDENYVLLSGTLLDINPSSRYWQFKINYMSHLDGDTTNQGSIIRISNLKYWCPDNKFEVNKKYLAFAHVHKKDSLVPLIIKCENILLDTPKNKEKFKKKYEDIKEISGYSNDPMSKEIRRVMPIAAEYCLLESSNKKLYGEWEMRLVNILDTITKIYPYEYIDLRNCAWNDETFLSFEVEPYHHVGGIDTYVIQNNGYKDSDVPKTAETISDYHDVLKDKFYIGIKYSKIWSSDMFYIDGKITLDPKFTGIRLVGWNLHDVCLPRKEARKDNTYYSINGEYNIRITGKCTKADMKKLQEMGNLDYPPEEGDVRSKSY